MTVATTRALALVGVLLLGACGDTYVDSDVTVAPTGPTTSTTVPAIPADAPLEQLLGELDSLMRHLDEQIVDDQSPAATMTRIEDVWAVAEQRIRDRDPDDLFPFEQAITLARSGVERNRPADASKGYKLLVAAIAAEQSDPAAQ